MFRYRVAPNENHDMMWDVFRFNEYGDNRIISFDDQDQAELFARTAERLWEEAKARGIHHRQIQRCPDGYYIVEIVARSLAANLLNLEWIIPLDETVAATDRFVNNLCSETRVEPHQPEQDEHDPMLKHC